MASVLFTLCGVFLVSVVTTLGVQAGMAALIEKYLRWRQPALAVRRERMLQSLKERGVWTELSDEQKLERIRRNRAIAYVFPLGFPTMFLCQALGQWLVSRGWMGSSGRINHSFFAMSGFWVSVPLLFFGALLSAQGRLAEEALRQKDNTKLEPVEPVFWPAKPRL